MTQDSKQEYLLTEWWEQKSFDSKGLFRMGDNGELFLKEYPGYHERVVGTISNENPDMVFNLLVEKFPEVEQKVTELVAEWDAETDKLKLVGKVERMKEYLHHASAVGDFHTIYKIVDNLDAELRKLIEANYTARLELVQKAETAAGSEDWKEASETMRAIAEDWKNIGYVDKERNDELWNRLETARDKFFERKREHQEDINKEMLQNLDLKMEIVEQADALAARDDWKKTTDAFKELMEKWKATGRTMHDKNEELWGRFIAAQNVFFERKKQHFEHIHQEQEDNYNAKLQLVEKAEALKDNTDWNETTKAYAGLMEEWKKIGRVPREMSDEIWDRFNAARDHFFNNKRENFESFKLSLEDNYAQKLALLKRAEDLQESNLWRETTDELNELMEEWKKIGPVPRKHSDEIWERFISARKKFFERKDAHRDRRKQFMDKKASNRLHQTRDFIGKIEAELREEQEKLADFKEGIENITPGMKKEQELREHLTKLIAQTEKKVQHKEEKLEEARKQLEQLENKD